MNELISVIIPVYNVEAYLSRCLTSVCSSSYSELEIICIDDGSTDRSSEILDDWAKKDKRIHAFHTENRGLSKARNFGMDLASGNYTAFIDSDDYISEYYFEVLLKELKAHNSDMAICAYKRTSLNEDTCQQIPQYTSTVLTKEEMISGHKTKSYAWGKLYRSNLLESVRFRPELKIEDAPFNMDVVLNNGDFQAVYIDTNLYFYFTRADSLATKLGAESYMQLLSYYAECAKKENNPALRQLLFSDGFKRGVAAEFRYWMNRDTEKFRDARAKTLSTALKCRKHGLVYCVFAVFPWVYKQYLTKRDPSIRNWKRAKKTDCA